MPIAPWLNVRRSVEALQFYKSAFGATEIFCMENPDGVVARLSIDGSEFWMSDEETHHANFSPESLNGSTVRLILTVEDVDASFARRRRRSPRSLPGQRRQPLARRPCR